MKLFANVTDLPRLLVAVFLPLLATAMQLTLLQFIPQTTWLLLYPAIFFSAWLCGFTGGIISTLLTALLTRPSNTL
jgi:hypothetical protein